MIRAALGGDHDVVHAATPEHSLIAHSRDIECDWCQP